jgi:hypothetical protein
MTVVPVDEATPGAARAEVLRTARCRTVRLGCACALGLKASASGALGTVHWIRDAVVATTVRVGVQNVDCAVDVHTAPNVRRRCGQCPKTLACSCLRRVTQRSVSALCSARRCDVPGPAPKALIVSASGVQAKGHCHSTTVVSDHDNRRPLRVLLARWSWEQRGEAPPWSLRPHGGGGEDRHGRDDLKLRSSAPLRQEPSV